MINNPESCSYEQLKVILYEILTEIMPLFDTANGNASIGTRKEKIDANPIQKVFKQEVDNLTSISESRRGMSIYNSSSSATVTIGCLASEESEGVLQLDGILAVIPPGKIYELPVSGDGSCYSGVIYGKSNMLDADNYIEITEFIAVS